MPSLKAGLTMAIYRCVMGLARAIKLIPFASRLLAGMNSIVLYLGHQTGYDMLPFNFIAGAMRTHWVNLPEAIWGTALWLLVALILYRNKVFIVV